MKFVQESSCRSKDLVDEPVGFISAKQNQGSLLKLGAS